MRDEAHGHAPGRPAFPARYTRARKRQRQQHHHHQRPIPSTWIGTFAYELQLVRAVDVTDGARQFTAAVRSGCALVVLLSRGLLRGVVACARAAPKLVRFQWFWVLLGWACTWKLAADLGFAVVYLILSMLLAIFTVGLRGL